MKRWLKWGALVTVILFGAWLVYTVLSVVAEASEQRAEQKILASDVKTLSDSNTALKKAVKEANKRCKKAAGCVPVVVPDVPDTPNVVVDNPDPDDPDPDDPETQNAEFDNEDPNDPESQDPEIDDPSIPGPAGLSCIEDVGLETCRGDKGDVGPAGPEGPKGEKGEKGEPGRGITDAQCDPETGRWVITYSDDTISDGGACMVISEPPPEDP